MRTILGLGLLLGTAGSLCAQPLQRDLAPSQTPEDSVELDPIRVTPQFNPLDLPYERLRKMMEDAPHLGSAVPFREDWTEVVAKLFVPPDPDFADRLEHRIVNDWRKSEWGPEMDDFR